MRWKRECINNLQARKKWTQEHRNLAVGDIVLMKEEQDHERGQKQRQKSEEDV